MTEQKHTPLPWKATRQDDVIEIWHDVAGDWKIVTKIKVSSQEDINNAEYIVCACNNHYKLLEVCKKLISASLRGPNEAFSLRGVEAAYLLAVDAVADAEQPI